MATLTASLPRAQRISPLSRLTVASIVLMALTLLYMAASVFGVDPVSIGIPTVIFLLAGLICTGWRWSPLVALVPGLAMPALLLPDLLPNMGGTIFVPGLVIVLCGLLAIISGVSATVQNYRRPTGERPLPRWFVPVATLLVGATAGVGTIGMAARPNNATGIDPNVLATLPAVEVRDFTFAQKELRIKAGQTVALRLDNGDSVAHSFDVDAFNVHTPMVVGQSGLTLFTPTTPGKYIFYCAPHYNKETGEGMHGTLVVE